MAFLARKTVRQPTQFPRENHKNRDPRSALLAQLPQLDVQTFRHRFYIQQPPTAIQCQQKRAGSLPYRVNKRGFDTKNRDPRAADPTSLGRGLGPCFSQIFT